MNFLQRFKLKSLQKKAKNLYDKRERGDKIDVKYEIKAYLDLAKFYNKHLYDKKLPNADIHAVECYRAAAILGSAEAQYHFARRQIDKGRLWNNIQQSMYGRDIHQTYARAHYEEAFNYIKQAEDSYPLAKRLHGMAIIHGWGVMQDKDSGFQLVLTSIKEEGTTDKTLQILQELGLNTPEFLAKLVGPGGG